MEKLIDEQLIYVNQSMGSTEELFQLFGSQMTKQGFASAEYVTGLIEREEAFPTGLPVEPIGVAIPHTDASFIKESKVGLITLNDPVEFREMGNDDNKIPVKVVIFFGFANGDDHLRALTQIIESLQDQEFVKLLDKAESREEAKQILQQNLNLKGELQ